MNGIERFCSVAVHARFKFCVYLYYFQILYLCLALHHMMQLPAANFSISMGKA